MQQAAWQASQQSRTLFWGLRDGGRRDQLRGIHAYAIGLIAIRYPTGRSACLQFACSLLSRRNDWVPPTQRGAGMPRITACPNSDRDRQVPARVKPLLLLSHAKQDDISPEDLPVRPVQPVFAHHKTIKPQNSKESRPRLPSTADPGIFDGPHAHLVWTPAADSCSPPSLGATGAGPGILQTANLSLTASANQPPLPTISDTDGLGRTGTDWRVIICISCTPPLAASMMHFIA